MHMRVGLFMFWTVTERVNRFGRHASTFVRMTLSLLHVDVGMRMIQKSTE